MDQKYINLFDRFTHGGMNRRDFMEKLTLLAGSTTAATALLPLLENNYARADILPEGDPRIVSETLTYAGGGGYFVKPSAEGKYPGVIVIHENRGLNPHIKDVARRMAVEGFATLAPDYLHGLGGDCLCRRGLPVLGACVLVDSNCPACEWKAAGVRLANVR